MECQLVGRISRSSPGGIGSVWFADVRDGSSGEQASADEFGEADGRHLETAVSGGDAQQQIGDHGGQQLQSDGVWIAAEEGRDLEMLLDPSEQQLDLPAPLVEAADLDGGALEVVGEEGDLGSVVALETNAAHRDGELGIAFADQLDLGIVEDGEATAPGLADGPPALGAKACALLHAGHEAGAGPIDAGPPVVAAIALVVDVGAAGGDRHRPADLDVVDVGIGDVDEGRIVGHRVVDDMHLQPPDAAVALGPFDDFAERNGGGIDQPQHLATLASHQPVGQPRQPGEGLAEDRQRAAGIGIGQGRARQRADPEMVVVMGVGVPRRLQGAQTRDPAKLGIDQRHQMVPAAERLVVGIAGVTIHKRVKPTPRDRLEKTAKSAIAVTHARSFLSLDNQKVAGSSCCDRACTRVIVNRSPDSPASYGGGKIEEVALQACAMLWRMRPDTCSEDVGIKSAFQHTARRQHSAVIASERGPTYGVWPTLCALPRPLCRYESIILLADDACLLTELSNVVAYAYRPSRPEDRRHVPHSG